MTIVAGIDFGTSNSSVSSITETANCHLIALEENSPIIPTALFFEDGSDAVLYGNAAVRAFTQGEYGRFMRSIKRILGSSIMDSGTQVNGRYTRFSKIIEIFIRRLKNSLEAEVGQAVDSVVMGRPVRFRDNSELEDRKAEQQLGDIARSAGFKNVVFQFEPIAAAFAHEQTIEKETLACVVDIGGGTSDFTIIKLGKDLRRKIDRSEDILANTGVRIGGNDFDKWLSLFGFMPALGRGTTHGKDNLAVPSYIYSQLSEWSEINFAYTPKTLKTVKNILREAHTPEIYSRLLALLEQERAHDLLRLVEQTKIDLTAQESVVRLLSCVKDSPGITVTREEFNGHIAATIEKIWKSLKECLVRAGVTPDRVELVILTGGSTEIPLVKQITQTILPKAVFSEGNKMSSVVEGLAYDSRRRYLTAAQ